jgi:hypothetical protein
MSLDVTLWGKLGGLGRAASVRGRSDARGINDEIQSSKAEGMTKFE